MELFEVTRLLTDTAALVRVTGEVDLSDAESTAAALDAAVRTLPPPDLIVLDLSYLEFLSVAGARVVDAFVASCAERGVRTRVVARADSVAARFIGLVELKLGRHLYASIADAVNAGTGFEV